MKRYGNMLKKEDGNRGLNFLDPKIFESVKKRIAKGTGAVESFRLLNNMLSSQPLCFNLFGLMDGNTELAKDFWSKHFSERIKKITNLEFEYAPSPKEKYLSDNTAFDVYFEYLNPKDEKGFIGIEVKLTESFSEKQYDTPVYRKWSKSYDVPWKKKSRDSLPEIKHNQLWRDHLLAESIYKQPDSQFKEYLFLLIRHSGDKDCENAVKGYKKLLKDEDKTFYDFTLDRFISAFDQLEVSEDVQKWLGLFKLRYL